MVDITNIKTVTPMRVTVAELLSRLTLSIGGIVHQDRLLTRGVGVGERSHEKEQRHRRNYNVSPCREGTHRQYFQSWPCTSLLTVKDTLADHSGKLRSRKGNPCRLHYPNMRIRGVT